MCQHCPVSVVASQSGATPRPGQSPSPGLSPRPGPVLGEARPARGAGASAGGAGHGAQEDTGHGGHKDRGHRTQEGRGHRTQGARGRDRGTSSGMGEPLWRQCLGWLNTWNMVPPGAQVGGEAVTRTMGCGVKIDFFILEERTFSGNCALT